MSSTPPRLLLIETSGRVGQVAVAQGDLLDGIRLLEESRRHARDLAPAAQALLAEHGWRPADIDAVIVSRGPGSYTGLRVGIMSAKAFAYATGCAMLAVDTFRIIAQQVHASVLRVDVLADAQQDKVYVQEFVRLIPGAPVQPHAPLLIRPFAEWLGQRAADTWATGPGLRGHEQQLSPNGRVIETGKWDPCAESLLALGLDRYRQGQRDDVWSLEPIYLRPSAAEQQWQKREV